MTVEVVAAEAMERLMDLKQLMGTIATFPTSIRGKTMIHARMMIILDLGK